MKHQWILSAILALVLTASFTPGALASEELQVHMSLP